MAQAGWMYHRSHHNTFIPHTHDQNYHVKKKKNAISEPRPFQVVFVLVLSTSSEYIARKVCRIPSGRAVHTANKTSLCNDAAVCF